jgi:flavodoxin
MKAVVVYESLWGNTATIARAIAEGIGPECRALSTAQACEAEMEGVDFVVAGAPILGFTLPTDSMRQQEATDRKAPKPANLSHPSMRNWLKTLQKGSGHCASFETRIWWSPGSSAKQILSALERTGYRPLGREKFLVTGGYGPLKDGEVERAREWGSKLADAATQAVHRA